MLQQSCDGEVLVEPLSHTGFDSYIYRVTESGNSVLLLLTLRQPTITYVVLTLCQILLINLFLPVTL